MLAHKKLLISLSIASVIFLFFPRNIFAVNLLNNPGFEEGIVPWQKYGGELTLDLDHIYDGSASAKLTSSTDSTKWIYQVVSVTGGTPYIFSGYSIKDGANISSVLLRIAWYSSLDGSGQELSHVDSTTSLTGDNSSYQLLSSEIIMSPDDAKSARVKGVVSFSSASQSSVYFDHFVFEQTVLPSPTPTMTPTSTPEPTATPQPTSIPTPVLTSTLTPTPTIKLSLTPTKTPTPSLSLTPTPIGEVLGEEVASGSALGQLSGEENKIASLSEKSENKRNLIFPAVAAVLGLGFIGFSIFSFLKSRRSTVA